MAGERTRVAAAEIIVRDRTGPGVRSATSTLMELNRAMHYNLTGITALGNAMAGISTAIAGGFAVSLKAAIDFEAGMAGVARTTRKESEDAEAAVKNTRALGESLRELAKRSPVSLGRLTAIAEEAGALGIARNDVAAFTETIVQLVATTNLTDEAATKLARISGVMGVTAQEVGGLGSAILFMGRSTQSTEKEIVHFAGYLAPVVKAARGTTAELIALSAVLPSLGARAESSRTAVQKTIFDIQKAMREGGTEAAKYAAVTGKSVAELSKITANDGVQGLLLLVEGFKRASDQGKDMGAVMADLGITDARYVAVLKALALGIDSNVNKYNDLRTAIDAANKVQQENTELADAYAIVQGTASSQIQVFKNTIHDAALTLGDEMLPALKFTVGYIANLVKGFASLPGFVKGPIAVLIGFVGVMTAIAAVIALVGPRLLMVKAAFYQAGQAYTQFARSGANAAAILATANATNERSALRLAVAYGKMSPAMLAAEYEAYKLANARKVGMAIEEAAIALNELMIYSTELVTLAEEAQIGALAASARARNYSNLATEAAAAGNIALAETYFTAAEASRIESTQRTAEIGLIRREQQAVGGLILAKEREIAVTIARTEALLAEAAATNKATVATTWLGRALAGLKTKASGALAVLMLIALVALPLLGKAQENAAQSASMNAKYQAEVARVLARQKAGAKDAISGFIALQLNQINGAKIAEAYGIKLSELHAIIMGTASDEAAKNAAAKLTEGWNKGDKSAKALYDTIARLRTSFKGQGVDANAAASSLDGLGSAADDSKKKLDDLRKANEQINQALLALPQALLSQREAALAVADAQDEYNRVLAESRDGAQRLKDAESKLTLAQLDRQQALRDVAKAEIELSRARQEAVDEVAEAEDAYIDAQDSVYEADKRVLEAEEALRKLREGPTVEDLTKATNKLADANLKLRDSQFKVRDAQYMLNYLMAEGASLRDLEEAQFNLDSANQAVANSTMDVADAQKDLNELVAPTPEAIAEAEREVESARRDSAEAARDLVDAEQELSDARSALANDDKYREASARLTQARLDAADATRTLREAEKGLEDARKNTSATRDLAEAQLNLEQALYRQAEANVEVQKQMALSRGESYGSGREARALAGELSRLGITIGGPVRRDFEKFSGILSGAKKDIEEADEALDDFGDGFDPGEIIDTLGQVGDAFEPLGEEAGKGFISSMVDYFKENGVVALATGLIGLILGAIAVVLGAPVWVAALIVGLIAALVYWIYQHREDVKDAFSGLWDWIQDIPGWVKDRLEDVRDFVKEHWVAFALYIIAGIPGAILGYLWEKLNLTEFFKNLFNRDKEGSGAQGRESGKSLGRRLWEGFIQFLIATFNPRSIITGIFVRQRAASGNDGFSWGSFIGHMLLSGILGPLGGLGGMLGTAIRAGLEGLPGWIKGPINSVIGVYNGFVESIASKGFHIGAVKALGKTIFPEIKIDFGFMRGLKVDPLKMAEGGITAGRRVGMVGEMGAEAVLPLDRLYRMLAPLDLISAQLMATNQALAQLSGAGAQTINHGDTFNIHAGDADALEIAEEVVWKKMVRG